MGKFEEMMRTTAANADESLGQGRDHTGLVLPQVVPPARLQGVTKSRNSVEIPVDRVQADPDQPREEFDEESLGRLADSLKQRGQLQPIRVRWDEGEAVYRVVVGERRWRAARLAGINTVACLVVSGEPSPSELLIDQLMENVLREDLKPVEQARAYKTLMEQGGLTQIQLAETLQVAQSTIARALALLNLPTSIQEQVDTGELASNLAYEITKVGDPEEQTELARKAVEGRIKRDEIRAKVARPGRGGRPRSWSCITPDQVKVTIAGLESEPDTEAMLAALRFATQRLRSERKRSGPTRAA
jgi:ParB family transcriptional regulator, chromosome partitioning protein